MPKRKRNIEFGNNKRGWEKYESSTPPLRSGTFTKEEIRLLKESLDNYCKENDITEAELFGGCYKKSFAWGEISACLPSRSVKAVWSKAWRMCVGGFGRWENHDIRQLIELVPFVLSLVL
jgi:hypothetical protein